MLILPRHDRHLRQAAEVIRWWQRVEDGLARFLLGYAVFFQAGAAVTLATAPWSQLLTQGTAPVFHLASRYVWAVLYALAAGLTAATPWTGPLFRYLSWIVIFGLGGSWLASFAANVFAEGKGSAMGIWGWACLYIPIAAVALHQNLKKQ